MIEEARLVAWMTAGRELVENALREVLSLPDAPARLREAMEYAVLGGGKRLRPLLCLGAAEVAGGSKDAIWVAAALELIHAYSLIHDDLPSMDDDDVRRGRPSCHRAFDEATAVLAGDALQALAFGVVANRVRNGDHALRIVRDLAMAAGPSGMAGGQILDLAGDADQLPAEALERVHRLKTGALLTASVRGGAIVAGATDADLETLEKFVNSLGLAFQIADDVLDQCGDPALLGRPTGGDAAGHKSTFVTRYGLDPARLRARELLGEALSALGPLGERAGILGALARWAIARAF